MAGKFSLADLISEGKVSSLGTRPDDGREQIEYIDIDLIDDDPNNFYELSKVDELAANIELLGLQQPLRVRANPDAANRVIIVSGHRRRAAIRLLVDGGRVDLREIPCIRERPGDSAALQELRLIYANSDTRKLTSAEISKQAERVEMLLYQLKQEGYDFPGRMRDHVAEACKVSKSKLARLKVIRDSLNKVWQRDYEKGNLAESVAYALARMPAEHQRVIYRGLKANKVSLSCLREWSVKNYGDRLAVIDKLTCKKQGGPCTNRGVKAERAIEVASYSTFSCDKCCSKCLSLAKCKHACPLLADKVKQLRADAKLQRAQAKAAQDELDQPIVAEIMRYWVRFGQARAAAGKSVKDCYAAMGVRYSIPTEDDVMALEHQEAKYKPNTRLPYGYNCYLSDIKLFVSIADLLDVSLDYLLCRTDDPKGGMGQPPAEGWIPLRWIPGQEVPPSGQVAVVNILAPGMDKPIRVTAKWFDGCWRFPSSGDPVAVADTKCAGWFPLPADPEGDG